LSQKSQISISIKNKFFLISSIGIISLLMKLYLVDFSIPETGDSWIYILRGLGYSQGDYTATPFKTAGWPLFLSPFFASIESNTYLDYLNIARIASIAISLLTIIPVYLLARKFFDEKYSIVMSALFAFQPHLNFNSGFGYSEPLLILILVCAMVFLLRDKIDKYTYLSFLLVGLLWWSKMFGIIFILVFTLCYFVHYKNSKGKIKNYIICLAVFLVIISPILVERYEQYGNPIFYAGVHSDFVNTEDLQQGQISTDIFSTDMDVENSFIYALKQPFYIWGVMAVPYLIILFPIGMFYSLRNIENKKRYFTSTWVLLISSMIPPMVLFAAGYMESRTIFFCYPFLIIFATLAIKKIIETFNLKFIKNYSKHFLVFVMSLVVLSSVLVIHGVDEYGYGKPDTIKVNEIQEYGKFLIHNLDGTMFWSKGVDSDWISVTMIQEANVNLKNYKVNPYFDYSFNMLKQFNPGALHILNKGDLRGSSIEEIISKGEVLELKFISVGDKNDNKFFDELYLNYNEYPYLHKIFDSEEQGFQNYKVKTFEIDYEKFYELKALT